MDNNLQKHSSYLTVEDQLTLLKDSIELRFTHKGSNEFAKYGQADAIGQFQRNELNHHRESLLLLSFAADSLINQHLPQESGRDQLEQLKEQLKNKRSIRYICCMVIWLSLFTPFLNVSGNSELILGHNLISTLFGLIIHPSANNSMIVFVAIYPLMLILYAGTLALFPNHTKLQKMRSVLWNLSAGSGIFYFFAALTLFAVNGPINQSLATIGFGYYLSMVAIFAYHFLNQLIKPTTVS